MKLKRNIKVEGRPVGRPKGSPKKGTKYVHIQPPLGEDMHGIPQHAPGAKLDKGKDDYAIFFACFPDAVREVAKVSADGAKKYSEGGWRHVPDAVRRYENAMLRHYFAYKKGEMIDNESGSPHLAHLAWNALALIELTNTQQTETI